MRAENERREAEAKKRREEDDRLNKESERRLQRELGALSKRMGEIVEFTIEPNLVTKFRELNYDFDKVGRNMVIEDRKHGIFTEIDAFLENDDKVLAVEIKTKPAVSDVDYHIERMEKLRRYADFRGDKRAYLGAVAGPIISESVRVYALKNGFYVIEPSGDTFNITVPEGEYRPREW